MRELERQQSDPVRQKALADERYVDMLVRELNTARELTAPLCAKVKIRQQHLPVDATLYPPENGIARVEFAEPQFAVTPGQSAVFYTGDIVAGGAIIAGKL